MLFKLFYQSWDYLSSSQQKGFDIIFKSKKNAEDIFLKQKQDRRTLPNVPDNRDVRNSLERRNSYREKEEEIHPTQLSELAGTRYEYMVGVKVTVECKKRDMVGKTKTTFQLESLDISGSGIFLSCDSPKYKKLIKDADCINLKFKIEPGSMPEGLEMKVNMPVKPIRYVELDTVNNIYGIGFKFDMTLAEYANRRRGRYALFLSSAMMLCVTLFIVLMRAESVLYFQFNKFFSLYSILAAVFLLSRYLFGMLYKPVPVDPHYTPGVTIIIPCFNEEEWIDKTIISCMNQDYPTDKLEVIIVDDLSADRSVEVIKETIDKIHRTSQLLDTESRISYYVQEKNAGKRDALAVGIVKAQHELVVFVDSDSFLEPFAIRNLVQPFKDEKMGGVAGRTDAANVYTNWITKMQATRYYIAFRIMKAAESFFDTVTCLSGPLACYRKSVLEENLDKWLNQTFLGQPATFGDDRSMTNFVLESYRTSYQDTAVCSTIVPKSQKVFLKQQMRWKRSWLRETVVAGKYIWKKEPFAALFFYIGFIVPFAAPIIVIYNLVYIPITNMIFPTTFIIGIIMMSLLMSLSYLLFKRSTVWFYSIVFCLYYETVLLWQMPFAWVTFWKSHWGTRMTPKDIEELERKEAKAANKKNRRILKS